MKRPKTQRQIILKLLTFEVQFENTNPMTRTNADIDEILEEEVEDFRKRILIQDILDWEEDKLHKTRRQNKKDALDKQISEYLEDQ
jgi:hypothetical protein